jgi:8-oxo-dGTP pyrophosphatase MutT (NUDIX family)
MAGQAPTGVGGTVGTGGGGVDSGLSGPALRSAPRPLRNIAMSGCPPAAAKWLGIWGPGMRVPRATAGESIGIAARRELREELGVNVIDVGDGEFTIHDPDSPFLIVFAPVRITGEPECHEHIELKWGRLSELALLQLAPSDRRYVEFRLRRI